MVGGAAGGGGGLRSVHAKSRSFLTAWQPAFPKGNGSRQTEAGRLLGLQPGKSQNHVYPVLLLRARAGETKFKGLEGQNASRAGKPELVIKKVQTMGAEGGPGRLHRSALPALCADVKTRVLLIEVAVSVCARKGSRVTRLITREAQEGGRVRRCRTG